MNLNFSPTHCIFCAQRLPKGTGIYTVLWCRMCKTARGDKKDIAYVVSKDTGVLVKLEIRVRNWRVILRDNKTFIDQVTPHKSLLILPYYLDFDMDPENLVHKIHTLIIFS